MKRTNWSFPLRGKKIPLFPIEKVYGQDYWVRRRVDKREGARERAAAQVRVFVREPLLPWAQTYRNLTGTGNAFRNLWAFSLHLDNRQSGFRPLQSNSKEGLGLLKARENQSPLPFAPPRQQLGDQTARRGRKTWTWAMIYYLKEKNMYHMPDVHLGVWQKLLF